MDRTDRRAEWHACCRAVAANRLRPASRVVYPALLALGAVTLWVLLFAAFASLGGCSRGTLSPVEYSYSHQQGRPKCAQGYWLADTPRASLIFPAEPGLTPVPAEAITRADWPTTGGRYSSGQTVDYQEYWYDAQGLGPYDHSYGYRTFTYSRAGQQTGQ